MILYLILIFQLVLGGLYAGGGVSASASASASAWSWGGGWGGGWGGYGSHSYGYGMYPYSVTGGFYMNPPTPGYSYWRLPKATFTVQKNSVKHPLVKHEQKQEK